VQERDMQIEHSSKSLSSKVADEHNRVQTLKKKLENLERVQRALRLEKDELSTKLVTSEKQIAEMLESSSVLEMERGQLQTMCGDFQSHVNRQQEKVEKLTRDKQGLQDQLISKQKIIQEQRNNIEQLKEAHSQNVEHMSKQFDGFQARLQDTLRTLEKNTKLLSQRETELSARDIETQEFRSRLEITTIELERQTILNQELMEDGDKNVREISNQRAEITSLKGKLKLVETRERLRNEKLRSYEERLAQLHQLDNFQSRELQEYQSKMQHLQDKYHMAQADIEDLNGALKKHEEKNKHMQTLLKQNLETALSDIGDVSCDSGS